MQILFCGDCSGRMPYWNDRGLTKCSECGSIHRYKDNIDIHCCSFNMLLTSAKKHRKYIRGFIAQNGQFKVERRRVLDDITMHRIRM